MGVFLYIIIPRLGRFFILCFLSGLDVFFLVGWSALGWISFFRTLDSEVCAVFLVSYPVFRWLIRVEVKLGGWISGLTQGRVFFTLFFGF